MESRPARVGGCRASGGLDRDSTITGATVNFVIVSESAMAAEWMERRVYQSLHRAVETVLERKVEVVLAVRAQSDEVS